MADKTLPPEGLSRGKPIDSSARRVFLRRAVGVGVPVVLATVKGRSVLAVDTTANGSGCLSVHYSGWLGEKNAHQTRVDSCRAWEESQQLGGSTDQSEPVFNFDPEPEPDTK